MTFADFEGADMPESTIDARGRTTLPRQVRKHLEAMSGALLTWRVLPSGALVIALGKPRAPKSAKPR